MYVFLPVSLPFGMMLYTLLVLKLDFVYWKSNQSCGGNYGVMKRKNTSINSFKKNLEI